MHFPKRLWFSVVGHLAEDEIICGPRGLPLRTGTCAPINTFIHNVMTAAHRAEWKSQFFLMTNPLRAAGINFQLVSEAAFSDYTYSCLFACKQLVVWNYYDYCARKWFLLSLSRAQQLHIIWRAAPSGIRTAGEKFSPMSLEELMGGFWLLFVNYFCCKTGTYFYTNLRFCDGFVIKIHFDAYFQIRE